MNRESLDTSILRAYVTNLGKYVEGELVGEWLAFPTIKEQIQETFKNIGVDGLRYEEYFVTDYETNVNGVYGTLPEYVNLDELNYFATKLQDLSEWEMVQFEAAAEIGDYSSSVGALINLTENLDSFDFLADVNTDSDLGYYWVEESGACDTKDMGALSNHIDYESFGRDIRIEEGGTFTDSGYVSQREGFCSGYDGLDDIPEECKVFAYPAQAKSAVKEKKSKDVQEQER